ncbi:MAG TPA: tetratricopeptide repeat protein [Thermoanaerobaculia bacterium]
MTARRHACILGPLAILLCAPLPADSGDLGRIDFATSGSPAAQAHFLRGALLLHSFEFDDAADEFREAEKIEPGFAMAYWGEAMTFNHPLWMEQNREAALEALQKLAPTREERLAKAPTEREKGYLSAVEILYGEGDKPSRDRAYAEAMQRLHEKFPDDLDAASFYALALLGTCEGKRDVATYMKAAAIAEEVFAKNPMHPGAVHYLIHCYDDPVHAPLGMRAARVYAKIAPSAGHALHMPSHIFFAAGMWEEAAASNMAAWNASLERAKKKKLGPDEHNDHALFWLEYAQLQMGQYAEARKTLAAMEADARESGSKRTRGHLVWMRAAYLIETRQWNGDVARISVKSDDLSQRGIALFVDGMRAVETGDRARADKALAELQASSGGGEAHAHGGASYAMSRANNADPVFAKELEARILFARGEKDRALALAKEASSAEDAMSFDFGPPPIAKPTHELLGEMLLASGRPADAKKEFEASLALAPGRALSLLGLARAATKAGDAEAAQQAYTALGKNWRLADTNLPEKTEAAAQASAAGLR